MDKPLIPTGKGKEEEEQDLEQLRIPYGSTKKSEPRETG